MATSIVAPQGEPAALYPTDEEILGIVDETATKPAPAESALPVAPEKSPEAHTQPLADVGNVERLGAKTAENVPPTEAASQGEAPLLPEWIVEASAASPQASAQLAGLWQKASALENFDKAFYGNSEPDREQFLARLSAEKPAEFRAMFSAAQKLLAAQLHNQQPAPQAAQQPQQSAAVPPSFNATAYANFEHATNDAVVADLNRTISDALDRALSTDVPEGARRRIASDTLGEIHATLRSDRQLSSQVASVIRGGRLDDDARAVVVRLISARAKGLVAPAAKRVIGEWTGSVLATDRGRAARQQAAQSRVDITGGEMPHTITAKTIKPTQIDYHKTSDEEILAW